ncbi:MAG TPA: hypothetical protein PLL77_02765 [Pyrinomonadaceae bacterium]|nr:hypothetical protein [Pyrinomonadaceae bacterium]
MTSDSLQIINTGLISKMLLMDRDELWSLAETRLKGPKPERRYETIYFNGVENRGIEKTRDVFFYLFDQDREDAVYHLILDFCFEGERVPLDYYARCGYLDSGASCFSKTSDELIPFDNDPWDDGDWRFDMERFDVLTGRDVGRIVQSMEKNLALMTINTADDIPKVRSIMQRCYSDEGYNAAYIYDLVHW